MARRMIPQKDQDYIEVLSTALAADTEGNVKVGRNLHVDGKLLTEGGLASNGTTDLGILEGFSLLGETGITLGSGSQIALFGTTGGLQNIKFTVTSNLSVDAAICRISTNKTEAITLFEARPYHILCGVKGGSLFWLAGQRYADTIEFTTNMVLTSGSVCYGIAVIYSD